MSNSKALPSAKPSPEQSLVLGIIRSRDAGKQAYGKAKEYLSDLQKIAKPGEVIELPGGRKYTVQDRFTDLDQVQKVTIIDRYDLVEVKQ